MPDDRYEWLDEEAAERLLRGLSAEGRYATGEQAGRTPDASGASDTASPAEAASSADAAAAGPGAAGVPGSPPRPGAGVPAGRAHGAPEDMADRLAAVLGALAAAPVKDLAELPSGELCGEAAAVAAFREAQTGVLRSGSVAAEPPTGRRGGIRSLLPALSGRPLRAGLAVALAGCTLGGVGVATSAGVLPTPFGTGGGGFSSPEDRTSPAGHPGETQHSGGEQGEGSSGGSQADGGASAGPSDSVSAGRDGGESAGTGGYPAGGRDGEELTETEKKAMATALCRAYANDKLGKDDRGKLERAAGGAHAVRNFCAEHATVAPTSAQGGDSASGDGPGGAVGSATNGATDGATGGGSGGAGSGGRDSGGGESGDGESGDGESGDGESGDGESGDATDSGSESPGPAASTTESTESTGSTGAETDGAGTGTAESAGIPLP